MFFCKFLVLIFLILFACHDNGMCQNISQLTIGCLWNVMNFTDLAAVSLAINTAQTNGIITGFNIRYNTNNRIIIFVNKL